MGLRQVEQDFSSFFANIWHIWRFFKEEHVKSRHCETLKNDEICQKFGKKWRNALFNACLKSIFWLIQCSTQKSDFKWPILSLLNGKKKSYPLFLTKCIFFLDRNIKIILLSRDPRGVYNSRRKLLWCQQNKDCSDIESFCNFMDSDYKSFKSMVKEFPDQLR